MGYVLLTIFGGASVVYRAFIFIDDCIARKAEKNIKALVWAIVCGVVWPVGLVVMIKDLIDVCGNKEISWLVK